MHEKVCESLREHAMKINDFQNKKKKKLLIKKQQELYENAKICYLIKFEDSLKRNMLKIEIS